MERDRNRVRCVKLFENERLRGFGVFRYENRVQVSFFSNPLFLRQLLHLVHVFIANIDPQRKIVDDERLVVNIISSNSRLIQTYQWSPFVNNADDNRHATSARA